jgi:uncharacterized protein YcbX
MAHVGTVVELWRYPVKSMAGDRLARARIGERGLVGDRAWALRDDVAGEIRGAKKFPVLLECAARYLDEPTSGRIAPAEITFPGGERLMSDDPRVSERLSALIGLRATLWPLQPAESREHYRRAAPDGGDVERELREIFGRLDDEPLPDLTIFPPELFEFVSPLGTYFDAAPLHLVTTASLDALARLAPDERFDPRRFRPNVLIEPADGASGFVETAWCGRRLRLGEVEVRVDSPTPRCSMTMRPQSDLPSAPAVLRTIVRHAGQNLGVYGGVLASGDVQIGANVELIP